MAVIVVAVIVVAAILATVVVAIHVVVAVVVVAVVIIVVVVAARAQRVPRGAGRKEIVVAEIELGFVAVQRRAVEVAVVTGHLHRPDVSRDRGDRDADQRFAPRIRDAATERAVLPRADRHARRPEQTEHHRERGHPPPTGGCRAAPRRGGWSVHTGTCIGERCCSPGIGIFYLGSHHWTCRARFARAGRRRRADSGMSFRRQVPTRRPLPTDRGAE